MPVVRSITFTLDQPLAVRRATVAGDFSTAERITADVISASRMEAWRFYPYEDFVAAVLNDATPELGRHVDEWVKSKDSAAARLFRAQLRYNAAWAARGHGYVSDTAAEHIETFAAGLRGALVDVDAAAALDPTNPYTAYLRLLILSGSGLSQPLLDAFAQAIETFPAYYPLYEVMLKTLQPKWGGSIAAMTSFVDHYAASAEEASPLRLLYVSFYRYAMDAASVTCTAQITDGASVRDCVADYMGKAVPPPMLEKVSDAFGLYGKAVNAGEGWRRCG